MKKQTLPIAIALASVLSAPTQAGSAKAYGLLTYNALVDDKADAVRFTRHGFAETRLGIKASHEGQYTYGAQIEFGLAEGLAGYGNPSTRNRIQELYISGDFGKVRLGSGNSVTFVISDVDSSGTWIADPLGSLAAAGATGSLGQNSTDDTSNDGTGATSTLIAATTAFSERIRYDSPKLGKGLVLSAQIGEAKGYEVSAKYNADGLKVSAWHINVGDPANPGNDNSEGLGILLGYKFTNGFNVNGTHMVADNKAADAETTKTAIKLGYIQGKHAVSLSNGVNEKETGGVTGAEHTRTTVSYVYSPVKAVKLWAQATQGETDNLDDTSAFAIGGMVKM